MTTDQKTLVRDTFNDDAAKWSDWAYDPNSTFELYPTGKPRIASIRREMERFYFGRKLQLLDAGCGSGDVALALETDGHSVFGVDFAPAMIAECHRRYGAVYPDRTDGESRFRVGDIERLEFSDASFDIVYAVGLLEYLEQDGPFLAEVRRVLVPGGLLLVECKNRLFNAVSANRFTLEEAGSGALGRLISELSAVARYSPRPSSDIPQILTANAPALASIRQSLETARKEQIAGKQFPPNIVRRSFTPAQFEGLLEGYGFRMQHVVYYHMHWLPPVFEQVFPQFYNAMSSQLDCLGETPVGAYLGSCFLAVGRT